MNHKTVLIVIGLLYFNTFAQDKFKETDNYDPISGLEKPLGIEDRAAGTHNASNIGLFFENRGKLYPRRLSQGPSGEFPINSGRHYIYRINQMVGVPGNVIQGRYTDNEEWEAVGGYHNPEYTKIAFSDNSRTWHPDTGWPVKDAEGNPVIKSDQDSYCVFSDDENSVKKLGIYVAQTGYTYGVKFAQNIIYYKYEISNQGDEDLDSLYFNLYCDIDVGNVSGGAPEYADDKVGFIKEKNLLYFYDSGFSSEWAGNTTGQFGIAMLRTPLVDGVELGATDMHYNREEYDIDRDDIQYAILSGDTSFIGIPGQFANFFHVGPDNNLHYDDLSTIPESGIPILANISSGPYVLNRGDTLVFYTALLTGENNTELLETYDSAIKILNLDFEASKPPATPTLFAVPGDGKVTLYWDDVAESSKDNFSGEFDFEGYRLYKSVDKGLHWDQFDRNVNPGVGVDPVPVVDFDVQNELGVDAGLQYSYIDTKVTNGFEYRYTITAYDRGDTTLESLESPRGNSLDSKNLVSVVPASRAIDRNPVTGGSVTHAGNGISNYVMTVQPADIDSLADREYEVGFTYMSRIDRGRLKTQVVIEIIDSSKTMPENYQIKFISATDLYLINLTTNLEIGTNPKRYRSGARYGLNAGMRITLIDPDLNAPPEDLPKNGDVISINFATYAVRSQSDTVVAARAFSFNKPMTTMDGISYNLTPPEIIQNVIRESGSDNFNITFNVSDETALQNEVYYLSVEGNGIDAASNRAFIKLMVRNAAMDTILTVDSLFAQDEFEFNGISALVSFPIDTPPSTGNVFSLKTVVPAAPNIEDKYLFKINGAYFTRQNMASEIKNIKVVPNPYIVASLYEEEFGELRQEPIRNLKFINLPGNCTIHIFSVAGDLVTTINHNSTSGTANWDLRADGGREIAAGIYVYVVKSSGEEFLGRFAVIK